MRRRYALDVQIIVKNACDASHFGLWRDHQVKAAHHGVEMRIDLCGRSEDVFNARVRAADDYGEALRCLYHERELVHVDGSWFLRLGGEDEESRQDLRGLGHGDKVRLLPRRSRHPAGRLLAAEILQVLWQSRRARQERGRKRTLEECAFDRCVDPDLWIDCEQVLEAAGVIAVT